MHRVGYVTDPLFLEHQTGRGHPESPERLRAIAARVSASGLAGDLTALHAVPADIGWIEEIHDPIYVERVQETCRRGSSIIDSMDTGISARSYDAALLAAGAGLVAADAVMEGGHDAAFAAVRPPGHHALRDTAMGFCLFNNAAIVARYLQAKHGLHRVFIVDWDVHHGNGTQDTFYDDATVFYFSSHQWPFYPGTGSEREHGEGEGIGFTRNAPLPAGCGDEMYRKLFEEIVAPAIGRFRPDAVVISAGFDAHRDDPLGGMNVTEEGFASMTRSVLDASRTAGSRGVISLLEGGYDLDALAGSIESHLGVLLRG